VFKGADQLYLTEIYAASEKPLPGISGESFFAAVHHTSKTYLSDLEAGVETIVKDLRAGDLLLCLGAGSVGSMPERFLTALGDRSVSDVELKAVGGIAS
jgi:UDP-N-acetylmuramate--alanine ligase